MFKNTKILEKYSNLSIVKSTDKLLYFSFWSYSNIVRIS